MATNQKVGSSNLSGRTTPNLPLSTIRVFVSDVFIGAYKPGFHRHWLLNIRRTESWQATTANLQPAAPRVGVCLLPISAVHWLDCFELFLRQGCIYFRQFFGNERVKFFDDIIQFVLQGSDS